MGFTLASLALACTAPAPPPSEPPAAPAPPATPEQVLARAIRVPTVNPPGDEAPLAAYLVEQLRAAGVEARVIETPGGHSKVGRAAAWARVPGAGGRPPLVLLSHLDVVPADPEAWRHDPFAGVIEKGVVFGRGAQDAKGVTVVQLFALLELARRETPLQRDVILLATPDEETGGSDGAGWIARRRRELLGDAAYLLTEGGSVWTGATDIPAWHVSIGEKVPCWLRLMAEGPAGHSSVPPADAAVPRLVTALERVRGMPRPIQVVPEVARMFVAMAPLAPSRDAPGFADLAGSLASDPEFSRRFLARPRQAALVRDTLTITVLQGSTRTNVLAARASADLDARLLPGGSCEEFAARVREHAGDSVGVETLLSFPSSSSPVDTPLYRAVAAVARSHDPRAVVVPQVNAGFTDAHYFRELGIEAYGFVPRWHRTGEQRGVHGHDERISTDNLHQGIATLVEILEELDRQEN